MASRVGRVPCGMYGAREKEKLVKVRLVVDVSKILKDAKLIAFGSSGRS